MRILVPAVSSATCPDGVSRHAVNLIRCLLLRAEVRQVDVVIGTWQERYFNHMLEGLDEALRESKLQVHRASCARPSLARNLWYFRQLPSVATKLGSHLVHLTYPVPVNRTRFDRPVLVTLHDMYPYDLPDNFGYPRVFMNRLILRHCLAACDAIACVSETTRERLRSCFPDQMAKVSCVYNCVEPQDSSAVAPVVEGGFILVVAQHRKSKNIPLAFAVLRRLLVSNPALNLLLVGSEGPETAKIQKLLRDEPLRERVVMMDSITDQQLQWCYRNCEFLLATSSIEGFGLPVAEAILAGAPVVCADIPAFREFGETYCRFVRLDSDAPRSFVAAVRAVFYTGRPQPVLLPHLSSGAIAAQYVQLYGSLLSTHGAQAPTAGQVEHRARGIA